jgi:hypothetical protein
MLSSHGIYWGSAAFIYGSIAYLVIDAAGASHTVSAVVAIAFAAFLRSDPPRRIKP